MSRWTRKRDELANRWTILRDGRPVGRAEMTFGGLWNWRCDLTGEYGQVYSIEDAADCVRACAVLAGKKPNVQSIQPDNHPRGDAAPLREAD